LLRSYPKVDVSVLPTPAFVAKTKKMANDRYEVALSVGVWMALNFMLRQGATAYQADPHDAFKITVEQAALFTADGRMRVVRLAELEGRTYWNWYEMPSVPVEDELDVFLNGYLIPASKSVRYDLRLELAVAFLALHEMNHVMQGHFEAPAARTVAGRKQVEIISDLRAACAFPNLISECDALFSVDGRKRCATLIASGLSIGCAVFCLQMLNRSAIDYPSPTTRMMALVTLLATGCLPREMANSDRENLLAGMWQFLDAFSTPADAQKLAELQALTLGAIELDKTLSAQPSQYALDLPKALSARSLPIGLRSGAIEAEIPQGEPVSDFELWVGIKVRDAWARICRGIVSLFSAKK
jgi:hypothetical protein